MKTTIERRCAIERTARVIQLEGIFDVPPDSESVEEWSVDLPIEERDDWHVGLIVGASGSGKSTIARELFGGDVIEKLKWPRNKSVLDAFPKSMDMREITALLSSVGFSSPPSWLRPYSVLSTGEKFRVFVARALAERKNKLTVIDEFTSVVDRTVAQIGSAAVAKIVRKRDQQLVAVSCHRDVVDWLQPDWVYDTDASSFAWRDVQRRPDIELRIRRVEYRAWRLFARYHYLTRRLNRAAHLVCAFIEDRPVALVAVMPFPHATSPGWRIARVVCLPDFQGVGIGNRVTNLVAAIFRATGRPVFLAAAHPGLIHALARSKLWHLVRKPKRSPKSGRTSSITGLEDSAALDRAIASFRYVGAPERELAIEYGLIQDDARENLLNAGAIG